MLTARGLLESLRQRDRTALEVTEDFLARIERNSFGTFQEITGELALRDAKQLDNARSKNAQLPELWGLPIAHKDNVDVAGVPPVTVLDPPQEPPASQTHRLPQHSDKLE